MDQILDVREKIYEYFHNNDGCQNFFINGAQEERYAVYYTSRYLLQDTTESLSAHRQKGFSSNPLESYLEFWGIMKAIIIQQDAICELYAAVTGKQLNTSNLTSWQSLRNLRNTCTGHPAKKDRPKKYPLTRTFMGRSFGDYSSLYYEQWQHNVGTSHTAVELGKLIDEYVREAKAKLLEVFLYMKQQWP